MQFFDESLAIERVVDNLIVVFGRLLVFVEEEVLALGLAAVDDVVLELLLVHVGLLVLEVVLFIPVLVVFEDLLELLDIAGGFRDQDSSLCFLRLVFPINMPIKDSIDESAHLGVVGDIHIAHLEDRLLDFGEGVLPVPQHPEARGFHQLHLLVLLPPLLLLVVEIDRVVLCPQVLKARVVGSLESVEGLLSGSLGLFGLAELQIVLAQTVDLLADLLVDDVAHVGIDGVVVLDLKDV
jgi:hypothetical protein